MLRPLYESSRVVAQKMTTAVGIKYHFAVNGFSFE